MTKAALLVVLVLGCGSVTAKSVDGADGSQAATGGAGGELGGRGGQLETGGAGGELGGRGGQLETGGTGGELGGRGGQTATAGAGGGVLTAPACKGTFIGTLQPECPRIPSATGGWQCEIGCSDQPSENASGCVFYGVTYCVASCSDCRP